MMPGNQPAGSCGFTLVELLIATLLGSLLLTGALQAFARSHVAWRSTENLAALEEQATFALTALEYDIRLAGNWGLHSNPNAIELLAGVSVHCSSNDVSDWALRFNEAVHATDGSYQLPCPARDNSVANSDTLTLRYASPIASIATPTELQLSSSLQAGQLHTPANAPSAFDHLASFTANVHAWYLNNASSVTDSAGLYRYTLTAGGLMQNQEIIPGIEDFQITLGVDRDDDGIVDGFVAAGAVADGTIHAVRCRLVLRSALPEPGHADNGHWNSATANLTATDNYRRISAERTIWLRNPVQQ